jgi:hypothetical protein
MITFKQFVIEQSSEKKCDWCQSGDASLETQYFDKKSGINLCDECKGLMYQTQDKKMMDMLYQSSRAKNLQNNSTNASY